MAQIESRANEDPTTDCSRENDSPKYQSIFINDISTSQEEAVEYAAPNETELQKETDRQRKSTQKILFCLDRKTAHSLAACFISNFGILFFCFTFNALPDLLSESDQLALAPVAIVCLQFAMLTSSFLNGVKFYKYSDRWKLNCIVACLLIAFVLVNFYKYSVYFAFVAVFIYGIADGILHCFFGTFSDKLPHIWPGYLLGCGSCFFTAGLSWLLLRSFFNINLCFIIIGFVVVFGCLHMLWFLKWEIDFFQDFYVTNINEQDSCWLPNRTRSCTTILAESRCDTILVHVEGEKEKEQPDSFKQQQKQPSSNLNQQQTQQQIVSTTEKTNTHQATEVSQQPKPEVSLSPLKSAHKKEGDNLNLLVAVVAYNGCPYVLSMSTALIVQCYCSYAPDSFIGKPNESNVATRAISFCTTAFGLTNTFARLLSAYVQPSNKTAVICCFVQTLIFLLPMIDAVFGFWFLNSTKEYGYVILTVLAAICGFLYGFLDSGLHYKIFALETLNPKESEAVFSCAFALKSLVSGITSIVGYLILNGFLSFEVLYGGEECPKV